MKTPFGPHAYPADSYMSTTPKPRKPYASTTSPKLKIGDKVKVITEVSSRQGQEGTVWEDDPLWDWRIRFGEGEWDWVPLNENEVELVVPPAKFKVGDRVRISSEGLVSKSGLDSGVLEEDLHGCWAWHVKFADGDWCPVAEDEIELLPVPEVTVPEAPPTPAEPQKKFKVGDRVTIHNPGDHTNGGTGVIVEKWADCGWLVTLDSPLDSWDPMPYDEDELLPEPPKSTLDHFLVDLAALIQKYTK